jgi:DegV family protein with EDD domain
LSEYYPEAKITVIDSLNVSLGETLLLLHATGLKEQGYSYDKIVSDLENYKHHINVQFTVDDLFHLQRGGRVSKTTALVGSALNLKPFLMVTDAGTLTSDGTVRGRKKSLRALVDRMKDTLEDAPNTSSPVGIVHGNCIEDANTVADLVRTELGFTDIIINDISPSIGTHAGPGALGLIYHGKKKPPVKEEK